MNYRNIYRKIINSEGEFVAISTFRGVPRCYTPISDVVGTSMWKWEEITQAEYETYQVFGITEIDLYVRSDS